jgi:SAM-dependent methyltransferase
MELQTVVPWGRNLTEYSQMFALTDADKSCRILGCGDGPASFNAEMQQRGHHVVSIDPLYQFSADQIRDRVEATYDTVIAQVKADPSGYNWQTFRDSDDLGRSRLAAMEQFLTDYDGRGQAENRYINASVTELPWRDRQFDLCLCSHFLFLYSQQLSLEFHQAAIQSLLNVAAEVRIFPLLTLSRERSPYLDPVIATLTQDGYRTEIVTVDYEFQKGANQMLRIS